LLWLHSKCASLRSAQVIPDFADLFITTGGLNHIISIFNKLAESEESIECADSAIFSLEKIISFCVEENSERNLKVSEAERGGGGRGIRAYEPLLN